MSATPARRIKIGQSWGLGRFLFLIVFTVAFTALGLWQVKRQYEVIATGYKIDKELFEYRRLLETDKRLGLLLAAYKDPSALAAFAEDELGMKRPGRELELVVPDPAQGTVTPPLPAPPAVGDEGDDGDDAHGPPPEAP
ncbi:MAG: cell division protein FtsL [Deltaproteobacteria bacterium]|nr:cell division protein FtsL [Deltaproteobacteria bacterium]